LLSIETNEAIQTQSSLSLERRDPAAASKPEKYGSFGGYGSSSDEERPRTTMATPPLTLKVNPSREEVWSKNLQQIKEFYEKNGHLTLPRTDPEYARLSNWLTYQRRHHKTLRKDQLERLESINYKTAPIHREGDDIKWEVKYNRLKQVYDETGDVNFKVKDRALCSWLSKQKRLLRNNKLDPSRQAKLGKLGIWLSTMKGQHGRKKPKSKLFDAQWQSQFEKLKVYHRIKGDCNVPKRWKEDPLLGTWFSNQRMQYRQMKAGEADMDPDRIHKLEQLGFGSSVNSVSKKKDGRRPIEERKHSHDVAIPLARTGGSSNDFDAAAMLAKMGQ
jgi:hypothetical protein